MKKLLILLLLSSGVWAQELPVTGTVNLKDYPTRAEMQQAIKDAKLGSIVTPPVIKIPDCNCGLKLVNIVETKSTSVKFNFYGCGDIQDIYYFIIQGSDTLRKGNVVPVNDKPTVSFTDLPQGDYKFAIRGKSCISALSESKGFTIPKLTGEVTPPVVVPPAVQHGTPNDAKWISQGLSDHLNLSFTRADTGFLITDLATFSPESNYDFWYFVNGQIVKQTTPLKNFKYQSFSPIQVLKMQGRKGLDTFNRWEGWNDGYYSTDAGHVFSYNVTAGHYTGIFQNGNNSFFNPIPANYDPDIKSAQWADVVNPFKLQTGHALVANRGEWTAEKVFEKGVSYISVFDFPQNSNDQIEAYRYAGKTYSGVVRPESFLGLNPSGPDNWVDGYNTRYWPNGPLSETDAVNKARGFALHALTINETEEGSSYMPKDRAMWGYFYKEVRRRQIEHFESRGIKSYLAHNYFSLGLPDLQNTHDRSAAKQTALNPAASGAYGFWIDGSLKDNNLVCIAVYLNAPDLTIGVLYDEAYKMLTTKAARADLNTMVFLQSTREWRPNNLLRVDYPEGKYYMYEKIPLDPNIIIGSSFLAQVFGKGIVEWGGAGKQTGIKKMTVLWRDGLWFHGNATAPTGQYGDNGKYKSYSNDPGFPYATVNNDYQSPYTFGLDGVAFGSRMYAETFGKVEGGAQTCLRFRVDNGPWVNPSSTVVENVVDAWFDKRPIVVAQEKDGLTAWFYLNPFADNLAHKLDVILPNGQAVTETVSSSGIHAKLL